MNLTLYLITNLLFQSVSSFTGNSHSNSSLVVDLGYTRYKGTLVQDEVTNAIHTQFLGIRFAAPPTGNSRWREPTLPAHEPGIQLADTQPPMCLQSGFGLASTSPFRDDSTSLGNSKPIKRDTPPASEDCLFLNVYTPGILGQKSNLPVVVFIHGGGYILGSASSIGFGGNYNGHDIVRESGEGAIFVIFQYRLGLFGFLAGEKVKEDGVLNAGLLDQQFALQWVQRHIRKFGGDPSKVTIWGQSAGAGSVLQHIVANGGQTNPPFFRGAITSSTFLPSQYKYNDRIPAALYNTTVQKSNCATASDTLNCLRKTDVNILQAANQEINTSGFFGTFTFVPVVDGTFIRDRPTKLLEQGKLNVPNLLSFNNPFEGTIFVNPSTEATLQVDQYVSQLFPTFGDKEIHAVVEKYVDLGSNFSQANLIMGEAIFICPTYHLLGAFGKSAYKGTFAIPPGKHGDDLHYYFPDGQTPPYADPQFDKSFPESFLNFAMSLDPNVKWDAENNITPFWPKWSGSNEMLFNKTLEGSPDIRQISTSKPLLDRCNFWRSLGEHTSQ